MTNARTRARCSHGDLRRVVSGPKAKGQKTEFVRIVFAGKGASKRCDEGEVYVLI
jgi:hypothetical protein